MPTRDEIMRSMQGGIPPVKNGMVNRIMGVMQKPEPKKEKRPKSLVSGVRG